jgi:hypothetical protein
MTDLAMLLADAFVHGEPVALPAGPAPIELAAAGDLQAAVLAQAAAAPDGVRMAPGPDGRHHAGPLLPGRRHPIGTTLACAMFHRPAATAGVAIALAQDTPADADPRRLRGTLHAVLDISDSRLAHPPDTALFVADLAGLGAVVLGPPRRLSGAALARAAGQDCGGLIRAALDAFGDLPAGAVIVLAGLSPPRVPEAGDRLHATLAGLEEAWADFA